MTTSIHNVLVLARSGNIRAAYRMYRQWLPSLPASRAWHDVRCYWLRIGSASTPERLNSALYDNYTA